MKIAIYARKSKYSPTGESVENQIQLCKEYLQSKYKSETLEIDEYKDEGYSGGNTNRPDFRKLMAQIDSYDMLICYRLDRISRNVADFSGTLTILQNNKCDFVSIKEQFDTTSPLGRAMIYISSVFAQLERETIAERIRDNMMELAKMGRWLGGTTPIGFDSEPITFIDENMKERSMTKLKPNMDELKVVELIYEKYLQLGSMGKVVTYLLQNNIKTKKGKDFTLGSVKVILTNPIYAKANEKVVNHLKAQGITVCGDVDGRKALLTYNKTTGISNESGTKTIVKDKSEWIAAVGNHNGIIPEDKWLQAQSIKDKNKDSFPALGRSNTTISSRVLRCSKCGSTMGVTHGHINPTTGKKHYYYNCTLKKRSKGVRCDNKPAKAAEVDEAILITLENMFKTKSSIIDNLKAKNKTRRVEMLSTNRLDVINKNIEDKTKQIDSLVNKLSLDEDLTDILLKKIKALKAEIKELNDELLTLTSENIKLNEDDVTLDFIGRLLEKCSIIRTLDVAEQQQIIDALIPLVTWNGDTEELNIYPLGSPQLELKEEESKKK